MYLYRERVLLWYYSHRWHAMNIVKENAKKYLIVDMREDKQPQELVE